MCLLFTMERGHCYAGHLMRPRAHGAHLARWGGLQQAELLAQCRNPKDTMTRVGSQQAPSPSPFKHQLPFCLWPWHSALLTPVPHPHSTVSAAGVFTGVYCDTWPLPSSPHSRTQNQRWQAGYYSTESSPASQAMVSNQKYHPPSPGKTACVKESQQGRGSPGFSTHPFPSHVSGQNILVALLA